MLVWEPGPWMSVGSGLLMTALGALLVRADPRKDWNRIFALLAVFWGVQIVAQNLVLLVTDAAVADVAGRVSLAFLVPLYFFVVAFAAVYPRPRPPFGTNAWWLAVTALPGVLTLLVLAVSPELILQDIVSAPDAAYTMRWGPLFPYLVVAPLYAGFLYALFVMTRRLDEAASTVQRRQIGFVLAALVLFVAYNVPLQLLIFGGRAVGLASATEAQQREAVVIGLVMLAGLVLLGHLVGRLVRRARTLPEARVESRWLLALLGAAALTGSIEGLLVLGGFDVLHVVGLIRLVSVALIVYAIARYQLFDIELRIRVGATALSIFLVVGSLALAGWTGLRAVGTNAGAATVGVVVVALLLLGPATRIAMRFADRIAPAGPGDRAYLRKLEVYVATMESLQGHGTTADAAAPTLVALRTRLGLRDDDHGIAASLVHANGPGQLVVLRPGVLVFGRYKVGSVLGEGAVGRVFEAEDMLLGRTVVIKELLAEWRRDRRLVEMLLREAQVAGRLRHPNVVAVLDVQHSGDDHYVIMEHVQGRSLAERLAEGPLDADEAHRVITAVLAGLAAAHARGVVHRDVKPGNILLGDDGTIKLTDFGLADLAEGTADPTLVGLPRPGSEAGLGTLAFMAPEQAAGEAATPRADVYAVGAVAFLALTGRSHRPTQTANELAAREAIARAGAPSPRRLSALPAPWRGPIARALAPVPEDRFEDAAAFADALPEADGRAATTAQRPESKP